MTWVVIAWLSWMLLVLAATHIMFAIVERVFQRRPTAFTVGMFGGEKITLSKSLVACLTDPEIIAIIMHEKGHIHHRHVSWNVLRMMFMPYELFRDQTERQIKEEFEADSYAFKLGCGAPLLSALAKLSRHPIDVMRMIRLDDLLKGRRDAGDPNARDARAIS